MIVGVGTDIVEIERVVGAAGSPAFAERCFTAAERAMLAARKPSSAAGNFAAKEAVAKAMGTGFDGFGPADVEVLRDERGGPFVNLYGGAAEAARRAGADVIRVSIADCGLYAVAFAVAERYAV